FDRGEEYGAAGGPASGGEERYLEIWNLVFMQFNRSADGSLEPLAHQNIDTGAGLERILTVIEGAPSVWETSLMAPLVSCVARSTGVEIGADPETDVALRVIADHARTMTFLISDGVFPSNDGRGYVLRRIIRRAVLRAHQISDAYAVMAEVVNAVIAAMRGAYPALARDSELIATVVRHEEDAFRRTLKAGSALLDEALSSGSELPGSVAFKLHDTFGFPIELTTEIARGRGIAVDVDGFEEEMTQQRVRARGARQGGVGAADLDAWKAILSEFGPSEFTGYLELETETRVLALLDREDEGFAGSAGTEVPEGVALVDVVLSRTPFYAEGGGQVGDTGSITGPNGTVIVLDTKVAIEGVVRHTGYLAHGSIEAGEVVIASVDAERRTAIRRNHTATHLLQAALRTVLGSHVSQQGSLVEPGRLRFDFSHFQAMTLEEIHDVETIVNDAVLDNVPVRTYETSRDEAEERGAIAFFGERYGEVVRVVESGEVSVELCGGTHVHATGAIGPFRIASESSVGANTRRIFATTGKVTIEEFERQEGVLVALTELLHTTK
ncbi:MAG TPA: alanine--tRNA ligase, partial [Acidimicrobiales bacterium]|nr:alanine--tRNA ligase [Acidimicrobiales bacterium]